MVMNSIDGDMGFSFGFTIEVTHRYEFNRLIHGLSFGFTIVVILRYEFNRLIHGFPVGFTVEIIHTYELSELIDGIHLCSFLKSSIVMD